MAIFARYNSLSEYVEAATSRTFVFAGNKTTSDRFLGSHRAGWYGLEPESIGSLEGVARMATCDGWQRGADMLAAIRETFDVPRMGSIKRRRIRSDRGDSIDMQRVYTGQLDTAWSRTARQNKVHNPRVFIMADSLAMGMTTAETMQWRGAAATMLGDLLSEAGYSVCIATGFKANTSSGEPVDVRVIIKPYNAPWDLNSAAAGLCSPAFFRALGHAYVWRHASKHMDGTGMRVRPTDPQMIMGDDIETPHRFLAPQDIRTKDDALRWVREQVAALTMQAAA